ncbi:MAG: hypothetical protein IKD68_11685 [Solobacterium sp.]|nr:hypothetical protein [Solobacterium sp.]
MNENEINEVASSNEPAAVKPDYSAEITAIIRGNDSPRTKMDRLENYHESDIAEVIETLATKERRQFYRPMKLTGSARNT